jgi:hypothetical protein
MPAQPERILKALLRFDVSQADVTHAIRSLQEIEKELEKINKLSNSVARNIKKIGSERISGQIVDDFGDAERAAEKFNKQLREISQQIQEIRAATGGAGQPLLPQGGQAPAGLLPRGAPRLPTDAPTTQLPSGPTIELFSTTDEARIVAIQEEQERVFRLITLAVRGAIEGIGEVGDIANQKLDSLLEAGQRVADVLGETDEATEQITASATSAATAYRSVANAAEEVAQSIAEAGEVSQQLEKGPLSESFVERQLQAGGGELSDATTLEEVFERVAIQSRRTVENVEEIAEKNMLIGDIMRVLEERQGRITLATQGQADAAKEVADRLSDEDAFALIKQLSDFSGQGLGVSGSQLQEELGRTATEIVDLIERMAPAQEALNAESENELRTRKRISLIIDRVNTQLGDTVSTEEKLLAIIVKIASASGVETREAAELLANYKLITQEAAKRAREIGTDPGIAREAKQKRLAADAAKRAADATKIQATEEEKLANAVNAVASSLRVAKSEAAEFVAAMEIAGGRTPEQILEITRAFNSAEKSASGFGKAMRFGIAGFTTQIIGVQIRTALQPFFQLPRTFAEFAGMADVVGAKFLAQTGRIEQAQLRVGRAIAIAVLPVMERIADIAEDFSRFSERNPELVSAIATGVSGVIALAVALQAVGFALSLIGTSFNIANLIGGLVKGIAGASAGAAAGNVAAGAFGGAAGTAAATGGAAGIAATAATILPILIPLVLIALTAAGILSLLKINDESAGRGGFRALGQVGSLALGAAVGGFVELFTDNDAVEAANNATLAFGRFFGVIDDAQREIDPDKIFSEQTLNAIAESFSQLEELELSIADERQEIAANNAQEILSIESRFAAQRADIVASFQQQQTRAEEDFTRARTNSIRDFIEANRRGEEDYQRRRSDLLEDANKRIEQIQDDFRRKQLENERDHLFRVEDLVAARDALGLARELRRFRDQQAQAEEQNQARIAQERGNLQERLDDLDEQHAIERQRRADDFAQRLADQQAEFLLRRERERADHQERLREVDRQKAEELTRLKKNLDEQLELLDERYEKEREALEESIANQIRLSDAIGQTAQSVNNLLVAAQHTRDQINAQNAQIIGFMQQQLSNFTQSLQPPRGQQGRPRIGGRQHGGYVDQPGLYELAEAGREFVLSNSVTRGLERQLGGPITNESIERMADLAVLRSNSGSVGPRSVTVQLNNWKFEGALSAAERVAMRTAIRREVISGMDFVLNR